MNKFELFNRLHIARAFFGTNDVISRVSVDYTIVHFLSSIKTSFCHRPLLTSICFTNTTNTV